MQKFIVSRNALLLLFCLLLIPTTGFAMRSVVSAVSRIFSSTSSRNPAPISLPSGEQSIQSTLLFRDRLPLAPEKVRAADAAIKFLMEKFPGAWRLIIEYVQAKKTHFKITQEQLTRVSAVNHHLFMLHGSMNGACPKAFWGIYRPTGYEYNLECISIVLRYCKRRGTELNNSSEFLILIDRRGNGHAKSASEWGFSSSRYQELALGWQGEAIKGRYYDFKNDESKIFDSGLSCDVRIADYDPVERAGTVIEGCFYDRLDDETGVALQEAVGRVEAATTKKTSEGSANSSASFVTGY
jgi:hypothetical protein